MNRWAVLLVLLVLMAPPIYDTAKGDGVAVTVLHGYSGLRENLQLAYIDVTGNSERMHLFLSIASLNPGEELAILIPLRTHPSGISLEKMNSSDFRHRYGFSDIHELHIKQTNGTERFRKDMKTGFVLTMGAELGGIVGIIYLILPSSSRPASGGLTSYEHYETKGFSVDVYSFNSSDSVYEFYKARHLHVPSRVVETIERYGNFSVAFVNTITKPPIPEDKYYALETYVPDVMDDFREFVETHDEIRMYGYLSFLDTELNDMIDRVYDKLEELNYSIPLLEYFRDLVLATYGMGDLEGFEIAMTLPLYEGKAFFPLGTSPAWGKIGRIEIMFSCPDFMSLSFDRAMEEAYAGGKHYYLWKAENSAPDYDLEGELTYSEDTWKPTRYALNGILYDLSPILVFLIYLSATAVIIWLPAEFYVNRKGLRDMRRRDVLSLFIRSYVDALLSFVLGLIIVLALVLTGCLSERRKMVRVSELRTEFRTSFYILFIAPIIFFFMFSYLLFTTLTRDYFHNVMLFSFAFGIYFGFIFLSHILMYRGMKAISLTHSGIMTRIYLGIGTSLFFIFLFPFLILNPPLSEMACGLSIIIMVMFFIPIITGASALNGIFQYFERLKSG